MQVPNEIYKSYSLTNLPAHSSGTDAYQLVRYGSIVSLNLGAIYLNSITKDTWINLGQLPSELIPSEGKVTCAVITNSNSGNIIGVGRIEITTTGLIKIKTNVSLSTNMSCISASICWGL